MKTMAKLLKGTFLLLLVSVATVAQAQDVVAVEATSDSQQLELSQAVGSVEATETQTSGSVVATPFERYNRWMLSGRVVGMPKNYMGGGVEALYGRQFSRIIFLGVGFGVDVCGLFDNPTHFGSRDEKGMSIPPTYNAIVQIPVFADLQVNLWKGSAPLFLEARLGVTLEQISAVALMSGVGLGKRFDLKNNAHLNVKLNADLIMGIYYYSAPLAISVGYEF